MGELYVYHDQFHFAIMDESMLHAYMEMTKEIVGYINETAIMRHTTKVIKPIVVYNHKMQELFDIILN